MTPSAFIAKWKGSTLTERAGSQSHFIDLCRLLGEPAPTDEDVSSERYCFERGASKVGGGDGWADVWRKGCFGWEYKGKHKNLDAALRQLQAYALDLENPPYLVVSDMERIVVHTNWTNTVSRRLDFSLDDFHEPARLDELRQVLQGSERLKPGFSPQQITAKVAERFGAIGRRLQDRGEDPRAVAHFLNRMIFCMFAEDAGLLPRGLFTRTMRWMERRPAKAGGQLEELFAKMRSGGFFGAEDISHFNGGLFDDAAALPLTGEDLKLIADTAAEHDWSQIDPAVFGAMFEEALRATRKRAALGAHYTDREKILKIVEPVIIRPLAAEWDAARKTVRAEMATVAEADTDRRAALVAAGEALKAGRDAVKAGDPARRKQLAAIDKRAATARAAAEAALEAFLGRLAAFRVLDPACGSGNFLYVALHALRDIELRALIDAERLGIPQGRPRVGLDCVKGIEIEPYAAELARVTLWIGNLQWERKNGFSVFAEPILSSLDQIERRDALLTWLPSARSAEPTSPEGARSLPLQRGGQGGDRSGSSSVLDDPHPTFASRTPPSPLQGEGSERKDSQALRAAPTSPEGARSLPLQRGGQGGDRSGSSLILDDPHPTLRYREGPPSPLQGEGSEPGGSWVEAEWPEVDVIVGNPPFLGGKRLRDGLGDDTVARLFKTFKGRVPHEADFVCYWVEKAWREIGAGRARRAGFVTTNSIRGGASRRVLDPIADAEGLMEAWADEPWVLQGAAVRVSMIGFGDGFVERRVEGAVAVAINADLTGAAVDLTKAARLKENAGVAFQGPVKVGKFEISGEMARRMLVAPTNPNGHRNSDVLFPWANGAEVIKSISDFWIIDFGERTEEESSLFEMPFEYVVSDVKPQRILNTDKQRREKWWRLGRSGSELKTAAREHSRILITPRVSKHRIFVWRSAKLLPDSRLVAITRSDDAHFGMLHSRQHELWSLASGGWHGVGNDPQYTPTATFETFPFPEGLAPNAPAASYADNPLAQRIAEAAADLNAKREAWLNPPDLVRIEPEVAPGYPDRILPRDEAAAKELKKRTLTNLYNQRPAWLDMAHKTLDEAVAAAYGWPADLPDDEILERLFALNQERAAAGR